MLQGEHSAILSTFIKLPFVIKIFVLSIFEWPLKTGFTVQRYLTKLFEKRTDISLELPVMVIYVTVSTTYSVYVLWQILLLQCR